MEVEYEITPDDLYAFQWRASRRSPIVRRTRRKIYIYTFLGFLVLALLPGISADGFVIPRFNLIWVATVFPLVAFIFWYLERRYTRSAILELVKQEKPGGGLLGGHKISLNDAGLVESTAVGESRTSWAGVDRIEQNEEYIFIYTAPIAAHLIPKRAFSSLQETESFYQFAMVCKQAANSLAV